MHTWTKKGLIAGLLFIGCWIKPVLASGTMEAPKAKAVKMTFTNKLVDGKKTWLPSTVKAPAGAKVIATLINTLDAPHGFEVMGLSKAVVVNGKKTQTLEFHTKKKGTFKVRCQMHPAHVGATLVVK